MKCPNCGEEIMEGNECAKCGTTIISKKTEEETDSFKTVQNNSCNAKKTNPIVFIILAIVLIIIVLAAYAVHNLNKPRYIFDKIINQYLSKEEENLNFETIKVNADFEMSIDGEENDAITEFLNDAKFSLTTELDNSKQEEIVGIKVTKADEELINANAKLEAESQNAYVNLGDFFEKTIQLDIAEISEEAFEMADTNIMTFSQKINAKKANLILKKEINSQLKNEYFSAEKVENMTKNKLRLNLKEFTDVVKNIANNLAENKDFIDCFEDGEEVKENLKECANQMEELELDDEIYIEIDIYTKGITKTIERVDFVIEEGNETASIEIKKLNDEEYEYKIFENEDKLLDGTVKCKEENDKFEFEISAKAEDTTVTAKVLTNISYNEQLSDFDMNDVVKLEELTMEDIMVLYSNFLQSTLCEVVEEITNSASTDELPEYDLEEDFEYDFEDYEF